MLRCNISTVDQNRQTEHIPFLTYSFYCFAHFEAIIGYPRHLERDGEVVLIRCH